jgi:predicted RNase H-like HicB family nuclease
METENLIRVSAFWDSEANVWVANDSNFPGLVTEAETQEQLAEKLKSIISELIELNQNLPSFTYPLYLELTTYSDEIESETSKELIAA